MEWVVVGVLLCLAVFGEGGALPNQVKQEVEIETPLEAECLAGTEWESNCHYCTCSEDGVALCRRQDSCSTVYAEPIKCKPNSTFARDCNTCRCLPNGFGLCTMKSCKTSLSIPKETELPNGKECAIGSRWTNQCNDCWCLPTGVHACTLVGCENDGAPYRNIQCAPDTMWKSECNTCWCTTDGLAACTKKACISISDLNLDENAKASDSTSSKAAVKSSKNQTQEIVCVANRMFIRDCNTCWCNDDGTGFFCTRKVCVPELPEEAGAEEEKQELRVIKKECRPDEVFELDCNMCRCNPDGKSFSCTRRACADQVDEDVKNATLTRKVRDTSKDPPKACQPGMEFRLDCNKCLCDNEGQDFSCTRNDCNALNNHNGGARSKRDTSEQVTIECSPGSVFDKDCNVCRCTEDGHHAMCTIKRCTVPSEEKDVTIPEADPNFRCNPGEQFKKGCNDCSCSADGKSVFCTVRFCDQDITPPSSL